jgi:surface antigen
LNGAASKREREHEAICMMSARPISRIPSLRRPFGAAVLLLAGGAALAGNLSFLNDTAASKFNDDDVRLLQATAMSLLKDGTAGQSQTWANPNSTAKGTITVVKVFQSTEGFACKSLRIENSAAGWHGRSTYPVCQIPPGDWKIYSGAKPAPAS